MAVDATVAGASSDSYATLAEANAYVTEVGGGAAWTDLADAAKENFLKRATRAIDRLPWAGWKYDTATTTAGQPAGQRLAFPRAGDLDGNGDPYLAVEVVECCCAVALALAEGASESSSSDASVRRMKAGTVEIEFDTDTGEVTAQAVSDTIRDILGHRLASSVRMI